MRAIIYVRVSSQDQMKGYSLQSQEKACREYASKNGFEVGEEDVFIEEGESAKTENRTQLIKLLEHCRKNKGKIDALIVHKLDRFSRRVEDHVAIKAALYASGVSLKSVTENLDGSPVGLLNEHILAAFAQFDNDIRAERTTQGMKERVNSGEWAWKAPIGYINITIGDDKTIVPDKDKAPLIKQLFEEYSTGNYTLRQLASRISRLGLRTSTGHRVSPQALKNILSNKIYMGIIESKKWGIEKEGGFEKIVEPNLFYKVQGLGKNGKLLNLPRIKGNPNFPLRAFAKCVGCGKPLTASFSKGRKGRYPYYRCYRPGCKGESFPKQELENEFYELLKSLQPKPTIARLFREAILIGWEQQHNEQVKVSERIDSEIVILRRRKDILIQKNAEGVLPDEDLKEQLEAIKTEIMVKEVAKSESRTFELDLEAILAKAERVLVNVANIWLDSNLEDKQRLQALVFPKGIYYDGQKFGTAEISLSFKLIDGTIVEKSNMVARTGFEPVTSALKGRRPNR